MTQKAVYPGRFDPFTLGHLDIITRASHQFETCMLAVAELDRALWDNETRLRLVTESVRHLPNVEVQLFSGLLVDFMRKHTINVIVRGLRNVDDFHDEYRMSVMNRQILPECDTVFLMASPGVSTISATLVREIMRRGGSIAPFATAPVCAHYEQWHGA
jgi:pantetheine-phosphate adenylyltransferase